MHNQKGTIVLLTDRNSGFVRRIGVKEHLFFHSDDLVDVSFCDLKKGDKLIFSVVESRNGPYAVQVMRA